MNEITAKLSPAERMTAALCPECGKDLTGINPEAERDYHWSKKPKNDGSSVEALARYMMLTNFAASQDKAAQAALAADLATQAKA